MNNILMIIHTCTNSISKLYYCLEIFYCCEYLPKTLDENINCIGSVLIDYVN